MRVGNNELDEGQKKTASSFLHIKQMAKNAYESIKKEAKNASDALCENAKRTSEYQEKYDALMNEKKTRSLSEHEKERAKILSDNIAYSEQLRRDEFSALKQRLTMQQITEEEYYTALAALRDKYFSQGSDKWHKYTLQIAAYNQDVIQSQKKELEGALKSIDAEYEKGYNNILKKQEQMLDKLNSYSKIYNKVSLKMPDGNTLEWIDLSNLDADIKHIKNYKNTLETMQKRVNKMFDGMGLDKKKTASLQSQFFEQITELNIHEGSALANKLMGMSENELGGFMSKWVEKVDLTEEIANSFYAEENKRLFENYSAEMATSFSSLLKEKFSDVPETFFMTGENSAYSFKEGFLNAMDEVVNSLGIEMYKKMEMLLPEFKNANVNNVTNNSNYNIYGSSSPELTALEIYKQEEIKRMLTGG